MGPRPGLLAGQDLDFQHLHGIEMPFVAGNESLGEDHVEAHAQESGHGLDLVEQRASAGPVAGFFLQFAGRSGHGILPGVDAAGRKLGQPRLVGMTVDAFQHQAPIVQDRDHDHRIEPRLQLVVGVGPAELVRQVLLHEGEEPVGADFAAGQQGWDVHVLQSGRLPGSTT